MGLYNGSHHVRAGMVASIVVSRSNAYLSGFLKIIWMEGNLVWDCFPCVIPHV